MASAEPAPVTVLREPVHAVGGEQLLLGLRSSLSWLQANQDQVNDLNVFPVPDGDTGSNMYLTLRSAVEEAQSAAEPESASSVMRAAAHGSLMGARGNSGVILSQIFRGFSQALADAQRIDAQAVAAGLGEAARTAYKAVMKPTEGTILTVIREAGEAAQRSARQSDDISVVLEAAVREAHAAVERTIDQLQVLRDANVVDAGGFGLAVILEGFARALSETQGAQPALVTPRRRAGEPRVRLPFAADEAVVADLAPSPRQGAAAVAEPEEGWGYCTEFLINGPGLDAAAIRDELGPMGDSALVVGDADLVRVHIHTADPAALIAIASQRGGLAKLKVEDMSGQHHDVLERADAAEAAAAAAPQTPTPAPVKPLAVVSVAPGEGFREILKSLGCDVVVEGGQTMNPSIEDLLTAVRASNAEQVIILPNNGNVILTAQQVDAIAEGVDVIVVPTRNLPQGISALLALSSDSDATTNAAAMADAIARVSAVEVTLAVRATTSNGLQIRKGEAIAIIDGEIVQVGETVEDVVVTALGNQEPSPQLVTVYWGSEVDDARAARLVELLRNQHPTTEFEVHRGGQDHYPYVLSLE
ncbi:MAG: DAK2 domain-containing protein [Candidatus Dormibacteria bacterium]